MFIRAAGKSPGLIVCKFLGDSDAIVFDLYSELQTNHGLVNRLNELTDELAGLEATLGPFAETSNRTRDIIYEMVKLCDYNCGFVLPFFFPSFLDARQQDFNAPPEDDDLQMSRALSLLNRPFAFVMTGINAYGETTIRASRQIGKSITLGARQLTLSHIFPGYRSIYIAPHTEQMRTYANHLRKMERNFRYHKQYPGYRQNLAFKEYPNMSSLELVRVHTSAQDARGKTADELLFDEFQHYDVSLLPEVEQVLRASEIKCKLFAGTSLTTDTALEVKYQQGSQATWHVRCPDGIHWIDCGDPEQVLPIIKVEGPTCPYTGRILDMENGEYVHAFKDRAEAGFPSYHIPQIIIPGFIHGAGGNEWLTIYNALENYRAIGQLKKFLQEVLGIPTEEGLREISEANLKNLCCLPETKEALLKRAQSGYYTYVVSGIDWGGSDWNPSDKTKLSYTVHVILGVTPDRKIDILYMWRYDGMDYQAIIRHIAETHRRYRAGYVASDFAAGHFYNLMLRDAPGITASRHMILGYTGQLAAAFFSRPENSGLVNHYTINKMEAVTHMFDVVKMPIPRLRCYAWSEARAYLSDFLNVIRVPTESALGVTNLRFRRHGSKADDILHGIISAYTFCRILLKEPLIEDRALKLELDKRFAPSMPGLTGMGTSGSHIISG